MEISYFILKAQGSRSAGSLQEGRCALPLPSMPKAAKVSWGCQQASSCFPLLWVIPHVNNATKDLHLTMNCSCRLYSASLCHVPSSQPSSKLCFAPLKYFPTRSVGTLQNWNIKPHDLDNASQQLYHLDWEGNEVNPAFSPGRILKVYEHGKTPEW